MLSSLQLSFVSWYAPTHRLPIWDLHLQCPRIQCREHCTLGLCRSPTSAAVRFQLSQHGYSIASAARDCAVGTLGSSTVPPALAHPRISKALIVRWEGWACHLHSRLELTEFDFFFLAVCPSFILCALANYKGDEIFIVFFFFKCRSIESRRC